MKRFKSIVLAGFAVVLSVSATLPSLNASAVDTTNSTGSASIGLTPRKDYLIEPGKSVNDTILIRNLDQTVALQLTLQVVDFTYTGDGGTPKLFLAQDAPQTTWSLKPFLTVPETVTVPAGGSKSVPVSVKIPTGQGVGSYYSAIVYSTGAPNGGNVGLSASGVTLVFTTVPGQVNEKLTLEKLGAYRAADAKNAAGYLFATSDMPLNVGYTLKNSGNVAESPAGALTIQYMFGKKTTLSNTNPSGSLALIGQTRTFTACIKTQTQDVSVAGSTTSAATCADPGLWPGYYTVTADLFYGQNGNLTQEVVGNAGFWYLPIWFIVVFIIVVLALALFVWRSYVRITKAVYGNKMKRSLRRRK